MSVPTDILNMRFVTPFSVNLQRRASHYPLHRISQVTAVLVRVKVIPIRAASTHLIARILAFRAIAARHLCRMTTKTVTDIPPISGTASATTATTTKTVAGTGVSSCSLDGGLENGPVKATFSLLSGFGGRGWCSLSFDRPCPLFIIV